MNQQRASDADSNVPIASHESATVPAVSCSGWPIYQPLAVILLKGVGPLTPDVSAQYLRYISQGRRFGTRTPTWDLLRPRLKANCRQSYILVWSQVSTVVEVLTQRSRCEGTDPSHHANAAPVPVRTHN